jgi:L-alanine-DL-glutamate epimerase-like enolase superfamily enzyme
VRRNAEWLQGKTFADLDFSKSSLGLPEPRTADGFEIAIFDLLGKVTGLTVCNLLGGCHQGRVAVSYWTGQRTVDDLVRVAERAVELGFRNLKFKGRFGDPVRLQLAAAAKAAPSLSFIVDFNSSYPDLASFLPLAHQLQGFPLTIEDPVPKRLDWFAELRRRTTIPYALTPSGPAQAFEAIRLNAVDVFNNSIGSRGFVQLGYVAELAGIPMWHGSGVELGIRDLWFVHKAAATRSCSVPSDTLCYLRESDLLAEAFRPVDGFVTVPRRPGLGAELDEAAVRRYRA